MRSAAARMWQAIADRLPFRGRSSASESATRRLGRAGERCAERFLRRKGYRILSRNYLCPAGELDLVADDDGCIVFVEVKTRVTDAAADPEANITQHKRRQLEKTARAWLARHGAPQQACRFDAVSVVLPPDGEPVIRHIEDAFLPSALWTD